MKNITINKPVLSWLAMQTLAGKYHVRVSIAGHKIIIRSGCAEDLVRFVSVMRVLTSN